MSFRENIAKQEVLDKCGVTYGLPLFEQKEENRGPETGDRRKGIKTLSSQINGLPDWIWDGSQVKAEVYNKLKDKFSHGRLQILEALLSLGKGSDRDIKEEAGLEINQVTGRRSELQKLGVIVSFGETKTGPFGEPNTVYQVDYNRLKEYLREN